MPEFDSPEVGSAAPAPTTLSIAQLFAVNGPYPDPTGRNPYSTLGMVRTFVGNYAVPGAPDCLGQSLPIAPNQPLFNLIGTLYGGDGQVNFALPDLRGRVVLGGGPGQPIRGSLSMTYLIAARYADAPSYGQWPPLGTVLLYAAAASEATLPGGWLPADGRMLTIAQYPDLFNAIRTSFGGDGQTNFALPDLGGYAPIGTGGGGFLPNVGLGQQFPAGGPWTVAGMGLYYLISVDGATPPFPAPGPGWLPPALAMMTEVIAFAGIQLPDGWMVAAGQLLPISQHWALFQLLGTRYGGDGQTNFGLPNLSGMMIAGRFQGAG